MTPEEKARIEIDRKLENAGWKVCNRADYSSSVSATAVRESMMQGGLEADYLLFINGKAIGVLEAKRVDVDLVQEAAAQAENYTQKLPDWCPFWKNPLQFVYLSNGNELLYKEISNHLIAYELLPQMHTPKQLAKLAGLTDAFAGLPFLSPKGLRKCQFESITALENGFRNGQNRALMVLATGAGKTFTACMACYRLLSYTPAKRILFLVDRNNLGKQAEGEFGTFRLTENGEPFNTIFVTERLKKPIIPSDANVVIATIQRIFAVLTGQDFIDEDEGEVDGAQIIDDTPEEIGDNPTLSTDFFDYIVVDECHRSIYGKWQQVLQYFDSAKIIGLTATPAPETLAFFNNHVIINYTLEKSIADGINVDYRIFRIKTKVSEEGGQIEDQQKVKEIVNYTGEIKMMVAERKSDYKKIDLDRSVINPEQIRMVLDTFKNAIYSELYPDREAKYEYIPKTLIFAKNERHAQNIVDIVKQVFEGQTQNFVQTITYSAGDSNELIRRFRNDKDFRIAVTVNLVATGTDIKSLETLLFMRDVQSDILYTQMKGRGCRTIGDDKLQLVTPNAKSKDLFYIVDAVGVTEHDKHIPPLRSDELPTPVNPTLEQLLEQISHGYLSDDYLLLLSSRLSRINAKSKDRDRNIFAAKTGITMYDLAINIYNAIENNELPDFLDKNQPNTERKALVQLLAANPETRKYLLILNAGFTKILIPGEDELIYKGFSEEEAQSTTQAFEEYVKSHRDEIEALRIIYNNGAINYHILKDLQKNLRYADSRFSMLRLWNSYAIVQSGKVVKLKVETERECLTNLIQLVRFAFNKISELRSLPSQAAKRFELW